MASSSRRPALEMRTSSLVILCVVLSSETAVEGSVSEAESILTVIILLFSPTGTVEKIWRAEVTSRTAAMTMVFGRATRASRTPFPRPLLAPVMRYVVSDMVKG